MLKAIVYVSNTGFTKEYADLVSSLTSLPAYTPDQAQAKLARGDEIVFMGWVCASGIKGYNKMKKVFRIRLVCAVGMSAPTEKVEKDIRDRNHIPAGTPLTVLQGGMAPEKLRGLNKLLIGMIRKPLQKAAEKADDMTEEDEKMLRFLTEGGTSVSEQTARTVADAIAALPM